MRPRPQCSRPGKWSPPRSHKCLQDGQVSDFNIMVGGKIRLGRIYAGAIAGCICYRAGARRGLRGHYRLFRDHGSREARGRARVAFLIDDWGVERFRDELESRLGWPLERAGRHVRQTSHQDHLGVAPQSERGLYAWDLQYPSAGAPSEQLRQAAHLARQYGRGELRLSPGQNLILTHVPEIATELGQDVEERAETVV